ncbi:DUF3841 domain-containing protein [Clostridium sp.]|uniref:DUF3841 domain-containing protein n=1 Tax=Clostridium sp. TaxID=1506 RepID=UPI0025BFC228|nr:DUF3841 domain-containing protein [Clostridium sp.]
MKSLENLKNQGVHRNKKEYIVQQFDDMSEHYINAYMWFVNAASKIVSKPQGVTFPTWCSISEKNMLRPIENTVVYVLEVDASEIIYFDGAKWDYVLNHHYIPKDIEDEKLYAQNMENRGFKDTYSFIEGKLSHLYPLEKRQVMDSWMRVFEVEDINAFSLQANIWEIREDMIVDIIYYKG